MRRRKFLLTTATAALGRWCSAWSEPQPLPEPGQPIGPTASASAPLEYLRGLAAAVIEASRVPPGVSVAGSPANTTGGTLIRPGGRKDYPACWLRDFSLSLDCGLMPPDIIQHHLRLFARKQNGPDERQLKSGGLIPPFAITDHINFDGSAVFYPGTYSSGEDQGGEPWGVLPPLDNNYYLVHAAHCLYQTTKDPAFLSERIDGFPILERLIQAFDVPAIDAVTGAVTTGPPRRANGFGFVDTVYMTGSLLMPTLLRCQAAREMADLCRVAGRSERARRFKEEATRIVHHLPRLFKPADPADGWLRAATGMSGQPDVWGTLFALHLKVLPADARRRALATIARSVRDRTIEAAGAVRQVPADRDAGPNTAWEHSSADYNKYQNGAYWHTVTGWLIEALRHEDAVLAQAVFSRYLAHARANDFRQGEKFGAPWECISRDGTGQKNPIYMTSVTVPLAVLSKR